MSFTIFFHKISLAAFRAYDDLPPAAVRLRQFCPAAAFRRSAVYSPDRAYCSARVIAVRSLFTVEQLVQPAVEEYVLILALAYVL